MALRSGCARAIPQLTRTLCTSPRMPGTEKRFVRIAGPSSHASIADISNFLFEHDEIKPSPRTLYQGQSDVFQNHSIWLYDAGTQADAERLTSRISGRVLGLKLIRAAAVDKRIVDSMTAPPTTVGRRITLRKRLNIIAPQGEERGRALLATSLPHMLQPRFLWGAFSGYEVLDVRLLRKSGVACIIFATEAEAERALRERKNFTLQGKSNITLKMHE